MSAVGRLRALHNWQVRDRDYVQHTHHGPQGLVINRTGIRTMARGRDGVWRGLLRARSWGDGTLAVSGHRRGAQASAAGPVCGY